MIRVILEGLVKRFGTIAAVDGASLELRPGEMTYVLGPAGAGKTTLARLVTGLEVIDDGEIYFGDRMAQSLPAHDRKAGLVFQDLGLWPGLTVAENVSYPLKIQKIARADRRKRVEETLTALRIDSVAGRRPAKLSAVQRLRTALARALVSQPELLVLDEPLGTLDPRNREDFWDDLRRIHAEAGVTTLALTNDPVEALALGDRLAVMDLGRIIQTGTPQELYNHPVDVFVARLLGPTNLLQGHVESQGADARGEVVVRTPVGRLIGHVVPGQTLQGTPVTVSVRPGNFVPGADDPFGLEPVSGDD